MWFKGESIFKLNICFKNSENVQKTFSSNPVFVKKSAFSKHKISAKTFVKSKYIIQTKQKTTFVQQIIRYGFKIFNKC